MELSDGHEKLFEPYDRQIKQSQVSHYELRFLELKQERDRTMKSCLNRIFMSRYFMLLAEIFVYGFQSLCVPYCILEIFINVQPINYYDCGILFSDHRLEEYGVNTSIRYNYEECWPYLVAAICIELISMGLRFVSETLTNRQALYEEELLFHVITSKIQTLDGESEQVYKQNHLDELLVKDILNVSSNVDEVSEFALYIIGLIIYMVAIGLYVAPKFYTSALSLLLLLPLCNMPSRQIEKEERSIENLRSLREEHTLTFLESFKLLATEEEQNKQKQQLLELKKEENLHQENKLVSNSAVQTIFMTIEPFMICLIFLTLRRYQKMTISNAYIMVYIYENIATIISRIPHIGSELHANKASFERVDAFLALPEKEQYREIQTSCYYAIEINENVIFCEKEESYETPLILNFEYENLITFKLCVYEEIKFELKKYKKIMRKNKKNLSSLFIEEEVNILRKGLKPRKNTLKLPKQFSTELNVKPLSLIKKAADYNAAAFLTNDKDTERTIILKLYAQIAYLKELCKLEYAEQKRCQSKNDLTLRGKMEIEKGKSVSVEMNELEIRLFNEIILGNAHAQNPTQRMQVASVILQTEAKKIELEEDNSIFAEPNKEPALPGNSSNFKEIKEKILEEADLLAKKDIKILIIDNSHMKIESCEHEEQLILELLSRTKQNNMILILENFCDKIENMCDIELSNGDSEFNLTNTKCDAKSIEFVSNDDEIIEELNNNDEEAKENGKLPLFRTLVTLTRESNVTFLPTIVILLLSSILLFYSEVLITIWVYDLLRILKEPKITVNDTSKYKEYFEALQLIPERNEQLYKSIVRQCYEEIFEVPIRLENEKKSLVYNLIYICLMIVYLVLQNLGYKQLNKNCIKIGENIFFTILSKMEQQITLEQENKYLHFLINKMLNETDTVDEFIYGSLEFIISFLVLVMGYSILIIIFNWPSILLVAFEIIIFSIIVIKSNTRLEPLSFYILKEEQSMSITWIQNNKNRYFDALFVEDHYCNNFVTLITFIQRIMNLLFIVLELYFVPQNEFYMIYSVLSISCCLTLSGIITTSAKNLLVKNIRRKRFVYLLNEIFNSKMQKNKNVEMQTF